MARMLQLPADRAPMAEFPPGFVWFNTDHPLTLENDLRGRVVVLDFWTHCCINCMHLLPHLAAVEERFARDPVVVIGVHSGKFAAESTPTSVRRAIHRNRIRHPVIVDEARFIWRALGVDAWPTLVFIDAEGRTVGPLAGEVNAETIGAIVHQLLAEGRAKGLLAAGPLPLQPEPVVPSVSGLAFPGKVLAVPEADTLFVADSGHHRIIAASLTGHVRRVFGAGEPGLVDGAPREARFSNPQGMAHDALRRRLYVADTGNHALRAVCLDTGMVTTLAAPGHLARGHIRALRSPWDVALAGSTLLVAVAGAHQIWRHDLQTGKTEAWIGSGREDIVDGPPRHAALAQPTGLAVLGEHVFFVDSESSAVRRAHLDTGEVETLVGRGLFEFGDADGLFGHARLQHPVGIAASGDTVYVADTYNGKIRRLDLSRGTVTTLVGSPVRPLGLQEPCGVSLCGDRLFIADTNNHRILAHCLASGCTSEIALAGLEIPGHGAPEGHGVPVALAPLRAGEEVLLRVEIDVPPSLYLNPDAPMSVRIAQAATSGGVYQSTLTAPRTHFVLPMVLPEKLTTADWEIDVTFGVCENQERGLCRPVHLRWRARGVTVCPQGERSATIRGRVSLGTG